MQLYRTVKNEWSSENKLTRSVDCRFRCRYSHFDGSMCCTTYDFYKRGDTSVQREMIYYNEQWSAGFEKHYSYPSGTLYKETYRGDKSITFYQKNNKGLLTKTEFYEIQIEGVIK